jgi:kynurenine formamidase
MPRRIVDLTLTLHEGMLTFPVHWHPVVEITQLGRHNVEGRETRRVTLGTHTGTHLDAPRHFIAGGDTVEMIPLETLIGPARILDLTHVPAFGEVGRGELAELLGADAPERLILRFGWCRRWGGLDYYSDHPFLSDDAARLLVERGVRLLAMDTPMPDNPKNGRGSDNDSPVHRILLGAGVILVEYLCNLGALRSTGVELIVLPLKIDGADGCPVRAAAVEAA